MLVKIDEYVGFCVHRRSYLLGSPVIEQNVMYCVQKLGTLVALLSFAADDLSIFDWHTIT